MEVEVWALIISIVAILISIGVARWQVDKTKKINDINLEAELSKDIIKEFLTERFPAAITAIHFKKRKLTNTRPLQNALNELRQKLRFFKYCDAHFFEELKAKSQELEDYIVNNDGRYYSTEDQGEVMEEIKTQMTSIYSLLKTKYTDGKLISKKHNKKHK